MNPLIVIPAKDEEQVIAEVLDDIKGNCNYDILVVDDCSSDGTAELVRIKQCSVLSHSSNLGAWKSIQTGIRYALKNGYDTVVSMDADGQHKAQDLVKLIEKKSQGYDLVIGSCTSRGSLSRRIAWNFLRKLSGLEIDDLTSGYRVYGLPLMLALAGKRATLYDFQDIGVLLFTKHLAMRISEIEVEMSQRKNGISRIYNSWGAVAIYMLYTIILTMSKFMLTFKERVKNQIMKEGKSD